MHSYCSHDYCGCFLHCNPNHHIILHGAAVRPSSFPQLPVSAGAPNDFTSLATLRLFREQGFADPSPQVHLRKFASTCSCAGGRCGMQRPRWLWPHRQHHCRLQRGHELHEFNICGRADNDPIAKVYTESALNSLGAAFLGLHPSPNSSPGRAFLSVSPAAWLSELSLIRFAY
jgi:hypothetical protein